MPAIVTRQNYSSMGEDALVVEVCFAAKPQYDISDYPNPGAYVKKYAGEFETFDDPRDAARAAVKIRRAWAKDCGKTVTIRHGFTGGMTMPFDAPEVGNGVIEILKWAAEKAQQLPKCFSCGSILGKERYHTPEYDAEEHEFCSPVCVDEFNQQEEDYRNSELDD